MKRVLLVGEGPNDIGRWAKSPEYREDYVEDGVVGVWLSTIALGAAQVVHGLEWKSIRKFRTRAGRALPDADAHNVRALPLKALELGCDVVVFARDRDGSVARERAIREVLDQETHAAVAGGVAVENLEHWLAAAAGLRDSESKSAKQVSDHLKNRACATKSTQEMCALARGCPPSDAPVCAESLRAWIARVREVTGS